MQNPTSTTDAAQVPQHDYLAASSGGQGDVQSPATNSDTVVEREEVKLNITIFLSSAECLLIEHHRQTATRGKFLLDYVTDC